LGETASISGRPPSGEKTQLGKQYNSKKTPPAIFQAGWLIVHQTFAKTLVSCTDPPTTSMQRTTGQNMHAVH
jgi:hypothetical protein